MVFLAALAAALAAAGATGPRRAPQAPGSHAPGQAKIYLGFDRNDYPGDDSLAALRRAFAFAGYWLNPPPGESADSWKGKREILRQHGFGFLVLFNGRLDKELKAGPSPRALGAGDANNAVRAAAAEGFPSGTVVFVDQEEGGRLLPEQREYLYAWIDGVTAAGDRAGVYCSGMPDPSDGEAITADDLRAHAGARAISFFVYNDACPPSPGCILSQAYPTPGASGVRSATIWQTAQSPRRKNLTARCRATYAADGNCYPPGLAGRGIFVDLDVAASPDPSEGNRN